MDLEAKPLMLPCCLMQGSAKGCRVLIGAETPANQCTFHGFTMLFLITAGLSSRRRKSRVRESHQALRLPLTCAGAFAPCEKLRPLQCSP
jgi:hypothetical protein